MPSHCPKWEKYRLRHPYSVPILRALFERKLNIMRRPKGIKTKKSVAKRFKITGTGKVLRSRAGKRHLLQGKNSKRRRGLGGMVVTDKTDVYRIKQNLPFTR
jgi:large subunit ribosomal protein L35